MSKLELGSSPWKSILQRFALMLLGCVCVGNGPVTGEEHADIVIYGGTSAGVTAAIQASRMGADVLLLEPGEHLGGLTSGGLGATDIGNKAAIGGLSREFYQRVKRHYAIEESWNWERSGDYVNRRQGPNEDAMWFFEPHVAERIMDEWVEEHQVEVWRGAVLDRSRAADVQKGMIKSIKLKDGRTVSGKIFIDATYEGDLLAVAGVSFIVGRESNETYQETLNGIQTRNAVHHQIKRGVDPYLVPGDSKSGLLPGIDPSGPGVEGKSDHRVQAYCFRMCVTDVDENRIPFQRPADYQEEDYELLFRNFEAGANVAPWHPLMMPNRKTDANNNRGVSTDFIGESYTWAEATDEQRQLIYEKHLSYQKGLMWTLANHERVPQEIRNAVSKWGNCKDEFVENEGWSHQLYIREARRMQGAAVMTQHHCQGIQVAEQPIGLAAYTMDSHHVQRYVTSDGDVQNEGDVQVGGFPPYQIGYQAILPRKSECRNLLVPVCLSASHIAYGSIRMEPVFMVLGQSAATAAYIALEQSCDIHEVEYDRLRARLEKDKQVLNWQRQPGDEPGIDPSALKGIVLDDSQAEFEGAWTFSTSTKPFVGNGYRHDGNEDKAQKRIAFDLGEVEPGTYDFRFAYSAHANRSTKTEIQIQVGSKQRTVYVDQTKRPTIKNAFVSIGELQVGEGQQVSITVWARGSDGYVVVDAVWLAPSTD